MVRIWPGIEMFNLETREYMDEDPGGNACSWLHSTNLAL